MDKFYIQSGTGKQFTKEQIDSGNFGSGDSFIESGTGKVIKPVSRNPINPIQNNAITPEKLAPVKPIQVPEQIQTGIPQTQNIASEILKATEVAPTEAQQFQENTIQNIVKNMGLLQGEAADTSLALEQAGVANLKQDLQNINSQILKKQAEIAQDDIQLVAQMRAEERRDTLLPFAQIGQAKLAGDAQIMRALKTSEIGVLNALAIGKQGDIALAKETAQEAVDAKYAPYKQQIELGKAYLEAIEPLLSRDEKKQAREQDLRADLAMKEIEKSETNEKEAKNLAFILQQNGAPQSLINSALKATNIQDIQKIPGVSNYLMSKSDRLDIAIKQYALQEKIDSAKAVKQALATGAITTAQAEKATDLRKEYNGLQEVKNAKDSETTTSALLNALAAKNPTSDISAINSFQRIAVDPGVAVREGDVALLQSANSFGDKAWLRSNGYLKGSKLTDNARTAMQDLALKIHDARIAYATDQTAPIRKTAELNGIPFDTYVATPFTASTALLERVQKQQVTPEQKATSYVDKIDSYFKGSGTGSPFDFLLTPTQ
jgi:hypothetical protein